MKKRKRTVLSQKETNITREIDYIIQKAQEHDSHVVRLGPIIFFSTETGDAWLLDPDDQSALCLARDGEPQDYNVMETDEHFQIEWNARYRIDKGLFVVTKPNGSVRSIFGYPTTEIMHQ